MPLVMAGCTRKDFLCIPFGCPLRHYQACICIETNFDILGERVYFGRVSDSGARGRGFETYRRRVVSLSRTLYSPKVLVNYTGSGGSVPT